MLTGNCSSRGYPRWARSTSNGLNTLAAGIFKVDKDTLSTVGLWRQESAACHCCISGLIQRSNQSSMLSPDVADGSGRP